MLTTCWWLIRSGLSLYAISHETKSSCCNHKFSPQFSRIYEKLGEMFKNLTPATYKIGPALEATEMVGPSPRMKLPKRVITYFMQAPSPTPSRRSGGLSIPQYTVPTSRTNSYYGSRILKMPLLSWIITLTWLPQVAKIMVS